MNRLIRTRSKESLVETLARKLWWVRLTAVVTLALAAIACTGEITNADDTGGETPEQAAARAYFETQVWPVLMAAPCASCHAATAGVDFLAGAPDATAAYDTVRSFEPAVLNTDAPESSRLLTKGAHSGPALTPSQAATLLQWVNLEVDALPLDPDRTVFETPRITPLLCTSGEPGAPTCPINTIDLGSIGAPGAAVTFTVEPLSTGLYLSELKLTGGGDGVYVEHPLFVSWTSDDTKVPDEIDRFFATKMNLMAAQSDYIDGGTAAFMTFARQNPISLTFKKIDSFLPGGPGGGGGGPGAGGCKVAAEFTRLAQPQLAAKCAGPCHAGANANARNAVDMALLADLAPASQQSACNQILTRINRQNLLGSGILLAPDPASGTAHPFKDTDFANLRDNAIVPWATMERDAP
jgi:mono/diheme cytochrome c family protein